MKSIVKKEMKAKIRKQRMAAKMEAIERAAALISNQWKRRKWKKWRQWNENIINISAENDWSSEENDCNSEAS